MNEPVLEPEQRVVILTDALRIEGSLNLFTDVRLTDYLNESKAFIALKDAVVTNPEGRQVLKTAFMNVRRDSIQVIMPATDLMAD